METLHTDVHSQDSRNIESIQAEIGIATTQRQSDLRAQSQYQDDTRIRKRCYHIVRKTMPTVKADQQINCWNGIHVMPRFFSSGQSATYLTNTRGSRLRVALDYCPNQLLLSSQQQLFLNGGPNNRIRSIITNTSVDNTTTVMMMMMITSFRSCD